MPRSAFFFRFLAALLVVAAAGCAAALGWLIGSESGLHWLLARAEQGSNGALRVEQARGSLQGGVHAARLTISTGGFELEAERIDLDLAPAALLRKSLVIRNLAVDRMSVATRPGSGATALPKALELPLGVEIRSARVGRLRWTAGDRVLPEAALTLELASDGRQHLLPQFRLETGQGTLRGQARLDGRAPFAVEAALVASDLPAALGNVELKLGGNLPEVRLDAKTDGTLLEASARVDLAPFSARALSHAQVELARLESALIPGARPLHLRGRAELTAKAAGRYEGALELENADAGALPERLPLARLTARMHGSEEDLRFEGLNGVLSSGEQVAGEARWRASGLTLDVTTTGIDPQALHRDLLHARLAGSVHAELGGHTQRVDARFEGGRFHFSVQARRDDRDWIVENGIVRSGRSELAFDGRVGAAADAAFEMRGRLREFDPAAFGNFPQAQVNTEFTARGSAGRDWTAEVQLQIRDSRYRGQALSGHVRAALGRNRIGGAEAELALGAARVRASGALGASGDRLRIAFDVPRIEGMLDAWRGRSQGWVELAGALTAPDLSFEVRASGVARGAYRLEVVDAKGAGSASPDGPLSLVVNARDVRRGQQGLVERLTLEARGSRRAHRMQIETQGRDWKLRAAVRGALDGDWRWSGELHQLEAAPEGMVRLDNPLRFAIAPSSVRLDPVTLHAFGARIESGAFQLDRSRLQSRGRFSGLPLAWALPSQDRSQWRTDLKLGGEWTLDLTERLNGNASVWRESGSLGVAGDLPQSMRLEEARIELAARDNLIEVQARLAAGELGAFSARLSTKAALRDGQWIVPPSAPLILDVEGRRMSIAWLGQSLHSQLASEGELTMRVRGDGTLARPQLRGEIEGSRLGFSAPRYGLRLAEGVFRARLDETRLTLEEFRLRGAEGELRARGEASLAGMAPELRVEFDAQGLSLLARKDWALNIDTQGVFHAVRDRASLTGSLKINHALLGELDESGPELSEDVRIAGKEWIPPPERKPVRLHTDISLDLGERVRVRTRPVRAGVVERLPMTNTGLDAKLAGKLRIRGDSLAAPNATGEIQIVDGQYMVFGQRLKIVRGRIIFDGPLLDPNLNIVARRDDPEVVVGVRVTGTARAPRVTLFSQPDVSDTEKLTWLLFGRGAQPVDYSVTGLSTASSTVSSFGFQLSKRLYLAYEQGVSGTGSIMRLYSQLTKHLSAQWRSGSENSVRLFYGFFVK